MSELFTKKVKPPPAFRGKKSPDFNAHIKNKKLITSTRIRSRNGNGPVASATENPQLTSGQDLMISCRHDHNHTDEER